ncbi:MAG: T9SS type A sorting domain-containing protein [Bacteroidales bacterium]|nr:T9SS type A sorting domain-containing protein [Bacteroidales bacterium]
MKKTFTFITMLLLSVAVSAQMVSMTFSGRNADNNQYVKIYSVVVQNMTRGWTETLFWPDTVLTLAEGTGIRDRSDVSSLTLYQNTPNPFRGTTSVNLDVTEPGDVALTITDITGRVVESFQKTALQPGNHQMRVMLPAAGLYFLTVRQNGQASSIKMISNGGGSGSGVEYVGASDCQNPSSAQLLKSASKGVIHRPFAPGDQMEYNGYAFNANNQLIYSTTVQQMLGSASQAITLEFSETDVMVFQPCPGNPTVTDVDGNIYNTLQLGQQCWMRENLRVTHYSDGSPIPNGGTGIDGISAQEPRYYVNPSVDEALYGYLYNWPAAMHGAASSNENPSGVQGACPTGWHLPSDTEWSQLTEYVSSQSEYFCNENSSYIAKALAAKSSWRTITDECGPGNNQSTNNASGFGAISAGYFNGGFGAAGYNAFFWASTAHGSGKAYNRFFYHGGPGVYKLDDGNRAYGWSVRCLRD